MVKEDDRGKRERRYGDWQRRLTAVRLHYLFIRKNGLLMMYHQMTAERDRLRTQRDAFTKQFEELSKTRSTDIEGVFEKYKEKAGLQAKGKLDHGSE